MEDEEENEIEVEEHIMEDEEENEIEVEEHIMEAQIKCPVEEHKGMNAIKFCPECKIFLCNKC